MANTHTTLTSLFAAIADAIRSKNGSTETIIADNFPTEIENLRTGFDYNNQNVTSIADYEFKNCIDLRSVDCYNLTSIGTGAFEGCSNLKTVILYDGLENVEENAFKGCNCIVYYKGKSIPETWHENWNPDNCIVISGELIETWNISATSNDNVVAELYDIGDDSYRLQIIGNGNMNNFSTEAPWTSYKSNIKTVKMFGEVTSIGRNAFSDCTNLISINIPNNVNYIYEYAFRYCTSLTSITIPDSVIKIFWDAFYNCTSLTSIVIPNSVTSIGVYAFANCSGLTSITISDSVTNINDYTFHNCSSLTSITIPNSVTSIGNYAFEGCKGLTSIVIPDSVTSIANGAFYGCTGLTSITVDDNNTVYYSLGNCLIKTSTNTLIIGCKNSVIPKSVISIGEGAFRECRNLTDIIIPDSVTSIGSSAFYKCSGLTSITISNSVASIDRYAFGDCTGLTSITYTGTIAQWNSIIFGSYWNNNTGDYTIYCTDGNIAKDGTITYHTTE